MDPSWSRNPSNQRAAGEHARTIDAHSHAILSIGHHTFDHISE